MADERKIAFQGIPGAYSHMACNAHAPEYTPLPCESFSDMIAAVQNRDADLAMVPVENSTAGRVADIHHLLPESGLYIIGEHYQPVHHKLLGLKGAGAIVTDWSGQPPDLSSDGSLLVAATPELHKVALNLIS